jgi:hypothetical protein
MNMVMTVVEDLERERQLLMEIIERQCVEIAKLDRLVRDVNNCLLEKMPSVALQTIQLSGVIQ